MERRRSPRFRARFDALLSTGCEEGAGTLAEISYNGARLDEASVQPEPGTKVTLYIFVQPVAPFQLDGVVVRHTDTGFAIDYDLFDPEVRRLVDDVAAVIAA